MRRDVELVRTVLVAVPRRRPAQASCSARTAQVLALSEALTGADVPHAVGGAQALAYGTEDPRGTRDIDVNAFVPADTPDPVLAALPPGVTVPAGTAQVIAADGQVRLWSVDLGAVRRGLLQLVGPDDARLARWDALVG